MRETTTKPVTSAADVNRLRRRGWRLSRNRSGPRGREAWAIYPPTAGPAARKVRADVGNAMLNGGKIRPIHQTAGGQHWYGLTR